MAQEETAAKRGAGRRGSRWLRALGALVVVLVLALAGLIAFIGTETGLRLAVADLELRSGGALRVEGATGSLWSTIRAGRIEWRGPDATIVAETVALEWSPRALLSRRIAIRGVGAQALRINVAVTGPGGAPVPPPDLLLPFDVRIEHLGIARIDWSTGPRAGTITGLAFGYDGGRAGHRIHDLAFITEFGAIRGSIGLGAVAPFVLDGMLDFAGDGMLADVAGSITWSGTIEAPVADLRGKARGASYSAHAQLTPFAALPLGVLKLDAGEVDLKAFVPGLPATQLSLAATARAVEGRLDGRIELSNAQPGTLDAGRIPLERLATHFVLDGAQLGFDDALATLSGRGRVTGRGEVTLAAPWPVRATLAVQNLDLVRIHSALVPTELAGSLSADLDGARRRVAADLTQGDLALAFAAVIGDAHADIERFRARAEGGQLDGRGRIGFAGARSFDLTARAQGFDPSRFGRAPRGNLSGAITLNGSLVPDWQVNLTATLDSGSRIAGVGVTGKGQANVVADRVRDLDVDLLVAGATLKATGNAGARGDAIAVVFDAPQIASLAPLLPDNVPRPLSGALRLQGSVQPDLANIGMTAELSARQLQIGAALRLGLLRGRMALAPEGAPPAPQTFAGRGIDFEIELDKLDHPRLKLASARAQVKGTLGAHAITLAARGDALDVDARAHGALTSAAQSFDPAALEWSGTVDALAQREAPAFRLLAPATLTFARNRVRLGAAEIAIADGRAQIQSFDWEGGRATTRGSLTGFPLTTLARLAGRPFPLATDLVLGGEWTLAATPRANGTIALRREKGDIRFSDAQSVAPGDLAFGTTRLDATLRFTDDALAAEAALRSTVAGNADASLTLTPAGSENIDRSAVLSVKLDAELPTLKVLQPLLGTRAVVDGNARVAARAGGTLADPVVTGTLSGDGLRLDVPQHGVSLRDGRIRARLADRVLTLEEFSLAGGDGRFVATGVLARGDGGQPGSGTRVTWRADNFRLMNRPDRQLTVGGSGMLAVVERKLAATGELRVVSGHFSYTPPAGGALGDDVVVVGRSRPTSDAAATRRELPLTLDAQLDLGDSLTLSAEGLETTLVGRVQITSDGSTLAGHGTISAVRGTYYAFGQKLSIDRGRVVFNGPLDNPALDIVALRKNLAVEAGVELSGTVKVPQVRLVSSPNVPDGEKLAWLLTGSGLDRANNADLTALSMASASLLGSGGRPVAAQIAQSVGLDDISIRSGGATRRTSGEPPLAGQVVSFGKRLSENLSIAYEQGLTVASNALRIEYALSRTLTLRAEAGTVSKFGIYYRRAFE